MWPFGPVRGEGGCPRAASYPPRPYARGSEAVADLRGAELLLHRLQVGKPLGRLEAGERGHRAAVPEEPGWEESVGARSRSPPFRPRAIRWMGKRFPWIHRREGCPTAQPLPTPPPGPLPCPRRALRLRPGCPRLGFPPGREGWGARPQPAGALGGGPPPAAEITVGKVERRHEFLHPLQRSAPVLQGRRRRHRRAPAPLPGRPLPLPARPTAGNQRFRRPRGAFQPRAAFLGTLAALGSRGALNFEPAAESPERGFRGSPLALPN